MSDMGEQAHYRAKPELAKKKLPASESSALLQRLSMRARWTALITGIVAVISILGGILVYQQHNRALTELLVEQGISLVRLLAVENADAVLLEDWVGIQMVTEGIAREQLIGYLSVTDQQGMVRGDTDPNGIGIAHVGPQAELLLSEANDTRVYQVATPEGEFLHFEAPILFQQAEIGRIHLGLTAPSVQSIMLLLLVLQSLALVVATGFLTYTLGARLSRPVRILGKAMTELVWGRYECRIVENRRDEVGQIFSTFNRLAEFLQHSHSDDSSKTAKSPTPDAGTVEFDVRTFHRQRAELENQSTGTGPSLSKDSGQAD